MIVHLKRPMRSWLDRLLALALVLLTLGGRSPVAASQELTEIEEAAIQAAMAAVAPSVVRIETVGGLDRAGPEAIGLGPTTGVVVAEDGWIVSSNFSFAHRPDSILVTLPDGRRGGAQLVATDHSRQLVLLKIPTAGRLPVPVAAPNGEVRVGQSAIALGRTFDGPPNVSLGIVSALHRVWGKAIQTDAKISPNNYGGPLVDIQGRVIGILTPLSSETAGEASGAEYYDAGIGFAVPLEQFQSVLPKLMAGQDLHQGVIGVSLKGTDVFTQPAIVAACPPTSPAFVAGIRPGDEIVEAAGHPVTRQAELRHQIAPRYVGDKLPLVVRRDGQRLPIDVEIVAKLPPYERSFLGILPLRGTPAGGIAVRYVFEGSPAAHAGIAAGDLVTAISGQPVQKPAELADKLAELLPGRTAEIEVRRGNEVRTVSAQLSIVPETVPAELPQAHQPGPESAKAEPPTDAQPAAAPIDPATLGRIEIKLPEFENTCTAFVPPNYRPQLPAGLVVYLQTPGLSNADAIVEQWRAACEQQNLLIATAQPQDAARWQPREAIVIRRLLERLKRTYAIDDSRVVLYGDRAGGSMAYLAGISAARTAIRGLVTIDAALAPDAAIPPADPLVRLSIYSMIQSAGGNLAARIAGDAAAFRDQKYPVTERRVGRAAEAGSLGGRDFDELLRWIDSLDRL